MFPVMISVTRRKGAPDLDLLLYSNIISGNVLLLPELKGAPAEFVVLYLAHGKPDEFFLPQQRVFGSVHVWHQLKIMSFIIKFNNEWFK